MSMLRKYGAAALALAGIAGLAGAASADGYETRGGYRPAVSGYNWGGLYVGANAGWTSSKFDGVYIAPPPDRHSGTQDTAIYGGQVGLQHQWGAFVLGLEAAYSGTGLGSDQWASSLSVSNDCINLSATADRTCQNRMTSVFTVGPRIGVALDRVLFFAGAGFALGNMQSRTLVTSTGAQLSYGADRAEGWYVGGGVEWAIHQNVILGVEYQHMEFDTAHIRTGAAGNDRLVDTTADVVRARLSFKLGRAETYEPLK